MGNSRQYRRAVDRLELAAERLKAALGTFQTLADMAGTWRHLSRASISDYPSAAQLRKLIDAFHNAQAATLLAWDRRALADGKRSKLKSRDRRK